MRSIRLKVSKDKEIGEFNRPKCCDDFKIESRYYGFEKWALFINLYCPTCGEDLFIDKIIEKSKT